ncbi:Glycosyl transferase 4-like domain-containing protein [Loktanella sp. DSM 29012]|uniref:glycosyltransferase family 4 protein n=1 Tax=Loktanella sp. DSM 29012 TaxID=1881056 RepID=UPI0008BB8846|nr:glycosyltransferase family 4 protein [Loktanella sp. DSM 29012]SEQ78431.1 Glycosyl transferase 4-like domain-containing protein [Loktanella sp. DSM 29012]
MTSPAPWIVCQIGARENFAVARALARQGLLSELLTDVWAGGHPLRRMLPARLAGRDHPTLADHRVWAPTTRALLREVGDRITGRGGWDAILHRNAWFARHAAAHLAHRPAGQDLTVFAYSYAAGDIFALARARGWRTVLGQIDPGPFEARMVADIYAAAGDPLDPIPAIYWDHWRREVDRADTILVNSDWSRQGLIAEGVPADRITVVPLAFEGAATPPARTHLPDRFTADRPLRLLFLGQVTRRKGIDIALDAMAALPDAPLRLDVVGPVQITIPDTARADPRIVFHGSRPRHETPAAYAGADLFVFPTRSDGFGLTQLEALAQGLPVIASDRCGTVVRDGTDGVILPDLTPGALADTLSRLSADPACVRRMMQAARLDTRFDLDTLGRSLAALTPGAVTTGHPG